MKKIWFAFVMFTMFSVWFVEPSLIHGEPGGLLPGIDPDFARTGFQGPFGTNRAPNAYFSAEQSPKTWATGIPIHMPAPFEIEITDRGRGDPRPPNKSGLFTDWESNNSSWMIGVKFTLYLF